VRLCATECCVDNGSPLSVMGIGVDYYRPSRDVPLSRIQRSDSGYSDFRLKRGAFPLRDPKTSNTYLRLTVITVP